MIGMYLISINGYLEWSYNLHFQMYLISVIEVMQPMLSNIPRYIDTKYNNNIGINTFENKVK
jgi:hypothetical protein